MKIRKKIEADNVELQMTPMIDIVFQLLVFFILTFNVVQLEGDFSILMPAAAAKSPSEPVEMTQFKLRLTADGSGNLAAITLDGKSLSRTAGINGFVDLHNLIRGHVEKSGSPSTGGQDMEVELECDHGLKYHNVIKAMTAVMGYKDENGKRIILIEKIRFAQPANKPSK